MVIFSWWPSPRWRFWRNLISMTMGLSTLISTSWQANNFQFKNKSYLMLSTCSRWPKSQWMGLGIWSTCSMAPFSTYWLRTRRSLPVMKRMCSWIINTARTCRRRLRIRGTCFCLQISTISQNSITRRSSTKTKMESRASITINLLMCSSNVVNSTRQTKTYKFHWKYNSRTSISMTERNVWKSSASIPKTQRLV